MTLRILLSPAALAALALAALGPTGAVAQETQDQETLKERRVIVGSGPGRIWGLRNGGYLGVHLIDLTPELRTHFGVDESTGVLIGTVAEASPAAAAGLRVGDILTSIDGTPVGGRGELARRIAASEEGDSISLEIFRDGSYQVLQAQLEQRDRPQLWLNSLHDDGHYSMEWRSDDGNFWVLPAPGSKKLEIRRERLDEVMGNLQERLASPEFSARMLEFSSNTEELEQRIKELEQRLEELSKQLEKLEN